MKEVKEIEGIDGTTYAGKAAVAVKVKARGIMGDELLIFTLLDFVSFMQLNNKFASKGIFITDNNREECYIKVIESGDESLIIDLERYITLADNMKKIEHKKQEYQDIITKLQRLADHNDQAGVNSIVEEYLRR
jgi:PDZ domain-containing secreted protein